MNQRPTTARGDEVTAILVAGGRSARMSGVDKLWADLDGRPLIAHAAHMLAATPDVRTLIVVAPANRHSALAQLLDGCGVAVRFVEGGARRRDSVAAGMAVAPEADWYLVHDAARPLASTALATRVLAAAREHGAAVPGVPLADTVKRVNEEGRVLDTPERDALRAVQTPQAFRGALLRRAHAEASVDATDDAALVEHLGATVMVVEGEVENLKVTTPADLVLVRALLAERAASGR